jgi:hypothetical protein
MPSKTVLICRVVLFCAASAALYGQDAAPLWVTNKNAAFNEKEWVAAVESAASKDEARNAAASSLARTFKMDVKSVTNAMQSFSQVTDGGKNRSGLSSSLRQQADTSSDVAGLMGVTNDFWAAPDGTWYAAARMNRGDGARACTAIIRQNGSAVETLLKDAASKPASFDAYEALAFAGKLATVNDNYLNLLSVLDSGAHQSVRLSYGNAAAVGALMRKAAADIVIAVEVSGEDAGVIQKAFSEVFAKRNFRTASSADAAYVLKAEFSVFREETRAATARVRYLINAALQNRDGEELVAFTENKRVTSNSQSQAAARALRDAEKSITETGFAKSFDEHLASLSG